MTKLLLRTTFLAMLLLAGGLAANVSAQTVSGSIAGGTVTRGKAARATVSLNIPGGLHVNSNRPSSEYAIPTTVRASARGVRIGRVSYPRGRNRKFAFSENSINVYEGRVNFAFDVNVPQSFKGNTVAVRVVVNYQACTEEVCYPPKSKEVTLRASVR